MFDDIISGEVGHRRALATAHTFYSCLVIPPVSHGVTVDQCGTSLSWCGYSAKYGSFISSYDTSVHRKVQTFQPRKCFAVSEVL